MVNSLKQYTADHRYLLEVVARQAGFAAPVAIDLDEFYAPLLKAARKGELLPIDGVLVRDWDPDSRSLQPGIQLGMRLYEVEGVRFVKVRFPYSDQPSLWGLDFVAVDRKDYRRLYKIALRCRRDFEPLGTPPVLHGDQAEVLWKNTIGYLEPANLRRIKVYGGRPKRGVLLMGPPGNGKTTACRWIWEECRRRNWQWRLVSPDSYQQARHSCNPQEAVRELFSVEGRGIVFFDDMDLALRDRETVRETDDQAVFLGALDGISVQEGVVFVFTTNCAPELIDRAFKRPGRLDLVLHFKAPDAAMRRQLIDRWHEDIRRHVDMDIMISSTEGYSFAEIEELKNLLIMHFVDTDTWNWSWALDQFEANRRELANGQRRRVGFGQYQQPSIHHLATNGDQSVRPG
jgi:adenylate kinase family enzyme